MAPITSQKLKDLVAKAVEQALKNRTEGELQEFAKGPITIGIIAPDRLATIPKDVKEPLNLAARDPRLIGFIAPNIGELEQHLNQASKKK